MIRLQLRNQHLLWRAGFGPSVHAIPEIHELKTGRLLHGLLKASDNKPDIFDVADPALKELLTSKSVMGGLGFLKLNPEEKKFIRRQSVLDISKLNIRWLQEMTTGSDQLREKMSLFWHGHFATKTANIIYDQQLLQIIRDHALGNFRELLLQVCHSASIIQFLNNNQNKKGHPNENFARELMELFTIGRGNYSETDVKESARAFTGWGINLMGEFEFRPRQHDGGNKNFLGKTGNLSGEDILDILLERRETALFITRKIYRYYVNEHTDEAKIKVLAGEFYENGYDIHQLLIRIFSSEWFYDQENIGSQIKSPVLWLVGMRRQLPMEFSFPASQIILERLLGQVLFAPPNVAGWPGGKHWIDSSSLMLRLQIPKIFYRSDMILSNPKDDDDLMMGMRDGSFVSRLKENRKPGAQMLRTDILWNEYTPYFKKWTGTDLCTNLSNWLLQRNTNVTEMQMEKFVNPGDWEKRVQSITIRLMGTPEYQLC